MSTATQNKTGSPPVGASPAIKPPPTFGKDQNLDLPSPIPHLHERHLGPVNEVADLSELDDTAFEELSFQMEVEASRRAPESRGAELFEVMAHTKRRLVDERIKVASEAIRLLTGAITSFADREDHKAKVIQDQRPTVNHARERVEMTTKVKSWKFVHGKYTVWSELGEEARCGVIIKRRWNDRTQMTAGDFTELLEKLAWHFSLAER